MNTRIRSYALLLVCFAAVNAGAQNDDKKEIAGKGISTSEIRSYREMFRVNQQPVDMVEGTKFMCAPPEFVYGPHYDPGVVYYINETARLGVKTYANDKLFPVGSIIVKEKQERKTETSVRIVTAMKKVRPGRSEDSWEYKMFDTRSWAEIDFSSHGAKPRSRTCIECHRRYKDNDYVSDKGVELLLGR